MSLQPQDEVEADWNALTDHPDRPFPLPDASWSPLVVLTLLGAALWIAIVYGMCRAMLWLLAGGWI